MDVSGAEESDSGKSQVLVQHEHTDWDEVWVTQVVDEAADVPIVPGVNTVHLPILKKTPTTTTTCEAPVRHSAYSTGPHTKTLHIVLH